MDLSMAFCIELNCPGSAALTAGSSKACPSAIRRACPAGSPRELKVELTDCYVYQYAVGKSGVHPAK